MNPDRWRRVEEIYQVAVERSPDERAAYVASACDGDRELQLDVMGLLEHGAEDTGELGQPVAAVARQLSRAEALSLEGQVVGAYRIDRWIGSGGMGDVYRARDLTLDREVALKFLPIAFANDPVRVERLHREAQVLAALNHPHIAMIYGLDRVDATSFLVLELVDGETLSARIARAPLTVDETLSYARQLADALEAAHEKGVVHRDLKPANIALTRDDRVKVLDFGIARGPSSRDARDEPGTITGTPAYLSPEIVNGREADKRSDVWAFGCVLFEMLTRRRAFTGASVDEVLSAVLTSEPDWSALPAVTPPHVRRLLKRCLEKNRADRLRDVGDARLELETVDSTADRVDAARLRRQSLTKGAAIGGIAAAATAAILLSVIETGGPDRSAEQRFTIDLPEPSAVLGEPAIAPDGTRIVYPAAPGLSRVLYVRSLDRVEAQPLPGTEGATNPFFSPDGQWIAFFAYGTPQWLLKKVSINGGPVVTLCAATTDAGGTWMKDDTIVFAARADGRGSFTGLSLVRVAASGGTPTPLTTLNATEFAHGWPEILPDDNTILYSVAESASGYEQAHVVALSLRTGRVKTVIQHGYHARYLTTGHLLYAVDGNLTAVPFDVDRLEAGGPPTTVVQGLMTISRAGRAYFGVSRSRTLVYALRNLPPPRVLTWVGRNGREEPLEMPPDQYSEPRLSADGSRVAVSLSGANHSGNWIWDTVARKLTRATFGGRDQRPVWTGDGKHLVFMSYRDGFMNLYRQRVDGSEAVQLTRGTDQPSLMDLSPDGTQMLVSMYRANNGIDLMLMPATGGALTPLIETKGNDAFGRISPDGRWIAYESDELGSNQVHVRPLSDPNQGHWLISNGVSLMPLWSRDGRELFYIARQPPAMMAVSVEAGASFQFSAPRKVIDWPYGYNGYDVAADGRFLAMKFVRPETNAPANSKFFVVQHFAPTAR